MTLGKLSFSLWSGSVVAGELTVGDDPAFGTAPFLEAKSLKIGVDVGALVFHRELKVRKFVAESPEIQLIQNESGAWNYASLGHGGAAASQPAASSGAANVTVGVAEVDDGKLVVSHVPARGQPFVYDAVDMKIENLSFDQAMPFTMAAKLPGGGSVALSGTAGPVNQQNLEATPVEAQVTVKGFDPVKAGVVPASAGIGMDADVDAQVKSDGKTATSTGKVVARRLVLARSGRPAANAVNLTYTVEDDLGTQTGEVTDLAVQTGAVAVHAQGTFAMTGGETTVNLHVNATQVPVDAVEALLPAVGVRLPSGSELKGGTLTAPMTITGTTAALVIAGPVEVDNTRLEGFDLAQRIQGLRALTGTGGGTAIQVLRADVRETPEGTELTNIDCEVPALGTATGQGTVAASGALNFELTAKLSGSGASGATADTGLSGLAGGLMRVAGNVSVPVTITGTTSNPEIRADVGKMVKGSLGSAKKGVGGLLKGIVKK